VHHRVAVERLHQARAVGQRVGPGAGSGIASEPVDFETS
jgi:hypothetical protein